MMKYYRKIKTQYCDRRAMMAKARANTELCKGCRLCVNNCPRKAIIPLEKVNKKGYEIIEVDQDLCIGCGICYKVCPDYVFTVE